MGGEADGRAGSTRAWANAGLAASVAAAAVLVGLVAWGGAQIEGFSHRTDPISAIGADGASTRGAFTAGLIAFAVLAWLVAWSLRRTGYFAGKSVPRYVALIGASAVALAVLPCSAGCPVPCTHPTAGTRDAAHFAASLPIFVGAVVLGALGARRAPRESGNRELSACFAIVAVASTLLFTIVHTGRAKASAHAGPGGYEQAGEWERVLVGLVVVWIVAAAFVSWRAERKRPSVVADTRPWELLFVALVLVGLAAAVTRAGRAAPTAAGRAATGGHATG